MSMSVIEHIEVGSGGAASITFSSIPATYTDLYVVFSVRTSESATDGGVNIIFNGDSTNRSRRVLYGTGSGQGTAADSTLSVDITANTATSNTFANTGVYIANYRSSNAKSLSYDSVTENNATRAIQTITAGLWNDTSAITSLEIAGGAYTILEYSSATLFGITAGSDGTTTVS